LLGATAPGAVAAAGAEVSAAATGLLAAIIALPLPSRSAFYAQFQITMAM